jgi:hypothetical protein
MSKRASFTGFPRQGCRPALAAAGFALDYGPDVAPAVKTAGLVNRSGKAA